MTGATVVAIDAIVRETSGERAAAECRIMRNLVGLVLLLLVSACGRPAVELPGKNAAPLPERRARRSVTFKGSELSAENPPSGAPGAREAGAKD